jgi:hypothetical protein
MLALALLGGAARNHMRHLKADMLKASWYATRPTKTS